MEQACPERAPAAVTRFDAKSQAERSGSPQENGLNFWEQIWNDEAQGVSEYAMLLVLLVLVVVAAVHALGMNAQQVIDRVNTALNS
jgi:Flp pilus assembly pilin Flp